MIYTDIYTKSYGKEIEKWKESMKEAHRLAAKQSTSNYSSPIVAVCKKNGELRLCCDYRGLNNKTVPDRHPLPRIQESLDMLGGNSLFSLLDQGKAYHQGSLDQKSRRYTAFLTPWGLQGSYSFLQILFPDFSQTFQGYFGRFSLTFKLI